MAWSGGLASRRVSRFSQFCQVGARVKLRRGFNWRVRSPDDKLIDRGQFRWALRGKPRIATGVELAARVPEHEGAIAQILNFLTYSRSPADCLPHQDEVLCARLNASSLAEKSFEQLALPFRKLLNYRY